ncbi:MAG: hypothetical protein JRI36_07990 [Deltaproteobacteria bacterium]|nr:hypothetical protein [Deltaproteobacteria bacterium]
MDITKAKGKAEELVVRLRELVGELRASAQAPEWETQREQLKVIGDSIQHLENKNVPVPADLKKLKSRLEAEIENAEKQQMLLLFLKEQLSQLLGEIGPTVKKGSPSNAAPRTGMATARG